ncbi:four-carbon acid sugar kinase family protein [Mesorhizobium sp. M1A.F.Ca.IN.020.06.1.1]|nr:four-carbon acid sugar kinase family protein [Mesorhizobium sp.]RUW31342.1 four-carbon acid sugar kinase family protein [Mesorhizobium sp. M1A.F.Ca.IN.020.06.1.1]RWF93488.1 MAG: four-carbon acid sugar kinase family protein [Mesorhizobium sp.]
MVKADTSAVAPCIGFYGDDFTGGTANLANYQAAGLRAVMFLNVPSGDDLERYAADVDVVGVAGVGRSLRPDAMTAEIEPVLSLFRSLGVRVAQYKICSTFDSSPTTGNLATVISCAKKTLGISTSIPIVAACPAFGRYTLFANHFARHKGKVYRLDRHPVMSVHPATPMQEADLRLHLKAQGPLQVGSLPIDCIRDGEAAIQSAYALCASAKDDAVVFDGLEQGDVDSAARFVWHLSQREIVFAIAAQDFAHSLGLIVAEKPRETVHAERTLLDVDRMLVLSGSGSALNGAQIHDALSRGWEGVLLDPAALLESGGVEAAIERVQTAVGRGLETGRSVVVYTALGPDDPVLLKAAVAADASGQSRDIFAARIGAVFGAVGARAVEQHGLRRIVFAGGDTSSLAMRLMQATALRVVASRKSGGNISKLSSRNPVFDGLEVLLKGGQVGAPDILTKALVGAEWTWLGEERSA